MSSFFKISCDRCGLSQWYYPYRNRYAYKTQSIALAIPEKAGWCNLCKNICRMEPAIDARETQSWLVRLDEELSSLKEMLRRESARFALARRRSKMRQWKTDIYHREKEFETRLIEADIAVVRKSRKSPMRCLVCGGIDIEPLVLPANLGDGREHIGKVHPQCGGQLLVSAGGEYSRKGPPPTILVDSEGRIIE